MAEPRTKAGQRAQYELCHFDHCAGMKGPNDCDCGVVKAILAIEAEARTDREGPGAGLRERLEAFLDDEGNTVGGVWGDYGQVVVDASDVGRLLTGEPRPVEYRTSDYVATLNQAREALADCEAAAALRAPVAGERGDDANRECATCGDPIYCPSCASEASR